MWLSYVWANASDMRWEAYVIEELILATDNDSFSPQ